MTRILVGSISLKYTYNHDKISALPNFIFDARAVPNPGRIPELHRLTGKDIEVIEFLDSNREAKVFLDHALSLIEPAVKMAIFRDLSHFQIWFGCTGGRHRSVFFADRVSDKIRENFKAKVITRHLDLDSGYGL